MYVIHYAFLFVAGILLSIGAYRGLSRGFTGLMGVFVWFVLGNASAATVFWDGSGAEHVATSLSLTWLCYGNAAMHAVLFLVELRAAFIDDDTDELGVDEIAQRTDPLGKTDLSDGVDQS